MARDFVKDLNTVQQFNQELDKSEKTLNNLKGVGQDLGVSLLQVADATKQSSRYSDENLDKAKQQSKVGKAILNVLNNQNKGSKLGTILAKTKLTFLRKTADTSEVLTDTMLEQYDLQQDTLKVEGQSAKAREKSLKAMSEIAKSTLGIFGLSGGIVAIFTKFAAMTGTIGKEFGALGMTSEKFKTDILEAGAAATSLGHSLQDVVTVSKELTDNFGFGRDESVEMANSIIDTSMALGITNIEGAKLLGTLTQVAGMSFDTAQNFAKQTALLADAEGVAPNTVMRDIAASSETIAKFTGMTPEHLMKAAIQATKLGTTLSTIAGSMEGMLEFQTSLNAEIEASIMLGRDVNLQKARELALAGKADEFAVELTKQVGSQAEFEKMNVLQRKSLATALGISVEQMAKMVNNQEKVRTLGEAIANQDGLEKMIGPNAMDNMAKIVADLQRVGAELVISIGPTVSAVAGGIASFTQALSESKSLLPVLVGLMGAMAAKSLATAYSQLVISSALGGFGVGGVVMAGLAAGILTAGISSLPSFQGLPAGEMASLKSGEATFHAGETVVQRESLRDMNKELEKKTDKTNEKLDMLVTAMNRNAGRTAEALANV